MGEPPIDHGWAWMCVLGTHIITFFLIGGYKSLGILFVEFHETFGSSAAMTALMMGLISGGMSLLSPFSTAIGERIGYRRIVMVGGVITSLSASLTSLAPNMLFVALVFGLLTGIGYGMLLSPSIVVVGLYFNKRRSLANGIAMAGGSMGQLCIPQILRYLTDEFGFRGALLLYAGLLLHIVVGASLFRPFSFYTKSRCKKLSAEKCTALASDDAGQHAEGGDTLVEECTLCECWQNCDQIYTASADQLELAADEKKTIVNGKLDDGRKAVTDPPKQADILVGNESGTYQRMPECDCPCHTASQDMSAHLFSSTGSLYFLPVQSVPSRSTEPTTQDKGPLWDAIKASFCCCMGKNYKAEPLFEWDMFYSWLYITYLIGLCVGNVGYVNTFLFVPPYTDDLCLTKYEAALLMSVGGVSDLVGRLIGGWFADLDLIQRHNIMAISIALASLAVMVCPFFPCFPLLVVMMLALGFFGGFYISLMAVILVDFVGIKKMPQAFGMTVMFLGFSNMGTPPLFGYIRDYTGSYNLVFIICSVSMAICSMFFAITPIVRKLEEKRKATAAMQQEGIDA